MDILTIYMYSHPLNMVPSSSNGFFCCYFIAFLYIWYRSRGVRSCKLIHFTIWCTLIYEKLNANQKLVL